MWSLAVSLSRTAVAAVWAPLSLLLCVATVTVVGDAAASADAARGALRKPLVWGLDLGNDNTVMAVASRNGVDVVTNDVSGRQTPSAVFFAGNHRLIGEHTTGHAGNNPSNLVHHLKFLLDEAEGREEEEEDREEEGGRDEADADERPSSTSGSTSGRSGRLSLSTTTTAVAEPIFFCEIRRGDEAGFASGRLSGLRAVVNHLGQEVELSASEVISYLLQHCAGVVEREVEGRGDAAAAAATAAATTAARSSSSASCVVASVPSYFSLRQKRAVLDAASIAGVSMPMVMDEGTAVALAYGILKGGLPPPGSSTRPPLKVAFVDIGYGCTQVTVASFTAAGLKILGRGCARGGGTAAAEACVYDRVCHVASESGIAVKGRPRAEFRLAKALSAAVKTLSANREARLSVDCIDGDKDLAVTLRREEIEEACAGVAEGVLAACREALRAAGLAAEEVQDVELLGGGSYIPLLRRSVEETFGDRVRRTMSSSESVARGCALAAAQHSSVFRLRPFRVIDSLSRNLRLVWRYDRDDAGDGDSDDDSGEEGGTVNTDRGPLSSPSLSPEAKGDKGEGGRGGRGGRATGEVDVPAGTPIPWSTAVSINLGVGGVGKVHVHLMEGSDRVGSYVVDLAQQLQQQRGGVGGSSPGGRRGGAGVFRGWAGKGGAKAAEGKAAPAAPAVGNLKFYFRVDDAGMPSVQSASLEYEEEVTEFVEVPAPTPHTSPAAAAAAAAAAPAASGGDTAPSRGQERGGGQDERVSEEEAGESGEAESSHDGSAREGGVASAAAAAAESKTGRGEGDEADMAESAPEESARQERDSGDAAVEEEEEEEEEEEAAEDKGRGGGVGEGKKSRDPAKKPQTQRAAPRKIKVPRVVTRLRNRPVHVEQTYTGMLEGTELQEARERERSFRAQDEAVRSANEARNALENLLYAARSSLEPTDGELSAFISPGDAAAVLAFLEETEEWVYAPEEHQHDGATASKEAFEWRASSINQRLSEPRARREARAGLTTALDDLEAAAVVGAAQLEETKDSLSASQLRQGKNELASTQLFASDARKKLEAPPSSCREKEGPEEYGSLSRRLPLQEEDVRKKIAHLSRVLMFERTEHS